MTNPSTTLRTEAGPARLAGFRLDRVGGLPVTALTLSEPVRERLDRLAEVEAELTAAGAALGDAIFPLVPAADRSVRRRLLRARRLAHGGGGLGSEDLDLLVGVGVPAAVTDRWRVAQEALALQLAGLQDAVAQCAARTADTLRAHLDSGPLALSLPLVAAHLPEKAGDAELRPGARTSRTLLSYLVRAALKPSPLGRLTTVALHGPTRPQPAGRTETALPVGYVHGLIAELAATPRFSDAFTYAPAHSVAATDGNDSVVLTSLSDNGGFLWSTERIVDAGLYRADLDEVRSVPATALAPGRLARYVRTGLLVPVVPWKAGSHSPLIDLADALGRSSAEDAAELARLMTELDALVCGVACAEPVGRRGVLADIRSRADQLAERCGAPRWSAQLVHEDGASAEPVGPLPASVEADLRTVAENLRPYVVRSYVYDAVLDAFRARYGAGGRCEDSAGFFMQLQADSTFKAAFHRARISDMTVDAAGLGERAGLPVGRTAAPPSTAVLYQLAAGSAAAAHRGDYRMVVNQYGSALGGLVTRFGSLLGKEAVTGAQLGWLRSLFPGCEVRALTFSGQVNNLQHAGAGYLPQLHWPAEQQERAADSLGFDRLALRHDAATDTLEFEGPDGSPVAPVYTGIVPAHIATGAARLALAVMDPWIDRSPLTRDNHPFLRAQALTAVGPEPVVTPRATAGRVVLRRARWILPASAFPKPERGESTADHLLRLDRWRRDQRLPREVFFLALGADPLDANRRKPMWLDLASPHSVATALPLIAGAHTLRIEEALPGRDEAWIAGPDGPRMCEHVSFLAWDRPSGDHR
ncbi:lantibiotic dehydratase [Kitasatospora sp. NPDC085464]|uniref:lantibiotic dehydratase n=1 Tax=Kitasatospora sp. NPDC085464 TaxID=3364063 RepID=UPI0037CA86FD